MLPSSQRSGSTWRQAACFEHWPPVSPKCCDPRSTIKQNHPGKSHRPLCSQCTVHPGAFNGHCMPRRPQPHIGADLQRFLFLSFFAGIWSYCHIDRPVSVIVYTSIVHLLSPILYRIPPTVFRLSPIICRLSNITFRVLHYPWYIVFVVSDLYSRN